MASFKSLVVMFVAVMAIGQVLAHSHCSKLRDQLAPMEDLRNDATGTLEFAYKHMDGLPTAYRKRLSAAWNATVNNRECSTETLSQIGVIGDCQPDQETMGTLIEATKRHAAKCLKPEYINEMIESAIDGLKTKVAMEFIDHEFIATYRQENPNEAKILLADSDQEEENCCRSALATTPVVHALESLAIMKGKEMSEFLVDPKDSANTKKLEKYLTLNLFNPCQAYVTAAENVMADVHQAAKFLEGGERALLDSLNEEAQNAVFRYKLCSDLTSELSQRRLVTMVAAELAPQHNAEAETEANTEAETEPEAEAEAEALPEPAAESTIEV